MKNAIISIFALIVSVLVTAAYFHLTSIASNPHTTQDEGWKAFGAIIIIFAFWVGLVILNIVLIILNTLRASRKSAKVGNETDTFFGIVMNAAALLTLFSPWFVNFLRKG